MKRPRLGLSVDERPTPKLLNRIAGHVIYGHLQSIANELELPEGRASHAMADTAGAKPKTQIFKVNFTFFPLTSSKFIYLWRINCIR